MEEAERFTLPIGAEVEAVGRGPPDLALISRRIKETVRLLDTFKVRYCFITACCSYGCASVCAASLGCKIAKPITSLALCAHSRIAERLQMMHLFCITIWTRNASAQLQDDQDCMIKRKWCFPQQTMITSAKYYVHTSQFSFLQQCTHLPILNSFLLARSVLLWASLHHFQLTTFLSVICYK